MKYRESRRLTGYELRDLCIKKNWYTCGTCREYERLLAKADSFEDLTTERIVELAEDIIEHSDDLTHTDEDLESVMFEIARASVTFFYKD